MELFLLAWVLLPMLHPVIYEVILDNIDYVFTDIFFNRYPYLYTI